jgi:hypothetical protein
MAANDTPGGDMKRNNDIWMVVTLPEASEIWQLSRSTIIWAIWRDLVAARKGGKSWLLSYTDMCDTFGVKELDKNEG